MEQCVVRKVNGKLANRPVLAKFVTELPDGDWLILRKDLRKRSLEQNNLFHMWLPLILKGLRDAGYIEVKTTEDAKLVVKGIFLKKVVKNQQTGEEVTIIRRTSKLTKEEMTEFINEVAQWAAAYLNVVLPMPGDQMTLLNAA